MLKHLPWDSVEVEVMNPLLTRQCIHTGTCTFARIVLKKGCVVPEHQHVNEQISYTIEGALTFYLDGKKITVHPGEVLTIPANMPHKAIAEEDTVEFDIFTPARQDWINKTDAYLRHQETEK